MGRFGERRGYVVAIATVVFALLVVQIALAGGGGAGDPKAAASAGLSTKVHKLSTKLKKLKKTVRTLQGQVDTLPTQPGPAGPQGPRGPSFGDSKRVGNLDDIACFTDTVVGSMPLQVSAPARIWVYGQGALDPNGSTQSTFGLYLRLRNAADTTTIATSAESWDAEIVPGDDDIAALSAGGNLFTGSVPEDLSASIFVADPGDYLLQLVADSREGTTTCTTAFPDFGVNQGGVMGYVLLGTS